MKTLISGILVLFVGATSFAAKDLAEQEVKFRGKIRYTAIECFPGSNSPTHPTLIQLRIPTDPENLQLNGSVDLLPKSLHHTGEYIDHECDELMSVLKIEADVNGGWIDVVGARKRTLRSNSLDGESCFIFGKESALVRIVGLPFTGFENFNIATRDMTLCRL